MSLSHAQRGPRAGARDVERAGAAPGRRTLSMSLEAAAPAARGAVQRQAVPGPRYGSVIQALAGRATVQRAEAMAATGGGRALDAPVRGQMERSLGADFSSVRIHEDGQAAAVGALAFTRGDDLHFQPGRYEPTTTAGQELIGHELAHVVQQREGRVAATMQAKGVAINDDAGLEREADELGHKAARGGHSARSSVAAAPASGATVQRCVIQRVRIEDLEVDDDEIWDEVSYELFESRDIPSTHKKAAKAIFDRLPADDVYETYEDVADDVERALCQQLGESYPLTERTSVDSDLEDDDLESGGVPKRGSGGGGGGIFTTAMKLVVGYLALCSLVPKVGASTVPTPSGSTGPSGTGLGPLVCTVDAMGSAICSNPYAASTLSHVQCESTVVQMCSDLRVNGVYNGLITQVDKVCDSLTIGAPNATRVGECVFMPDQVPLGGELSCKKIGSYDASKVGHELEHAFDHCRASGSGGTMTPSSWVMSEIHAHTVQAAVAKLDKASGKSLDSRDTSLVRDFEAGCPKPTPSTRLDNVDDGLYAIAHMYHLLYVKTSLDLPTLISTYEVEITRAVARYQDMVKDNDYALVRNYRHIK